MNSKERVMRTIQYEETDRVPFDMFGTWGVNKENIRKYCNASNYEELYKILGIDIWNINAMPYTGEKRYYKGIEADYWGITKEAYEDGDSSEMCPLRNISSIDEVEKYNWPDPDDFSSSHIEKEICDHKDFAILGGVWAPIFHNVTWLCGFETTLVNLQLQPEVSKAIIKKVTDFWIGYTKKVLEAGKGEIDIIENCNDFGTQSTMIMSPENFREFFKPELKRLYDTIKQYDAYVMQHSCGSIKPIIPDLIEIGVNILNPVQVSAKDMNPEELKKDFGDKITFHGGVDTQYVLPNGNVKDVREEVRRIISILGKGGGYILSGSQGFESDIPIENIVAMYDEASKIRYSN